MLPGPITARSVGVPPSPGRNLESNCDIQGGGQVFGKKCLWSCHCIWAARLLPLALVSLVRASLHQLALTAMQEFSAELKGVSKVESVCF